MKKMHCIQCNKYRKFKKPKTSNIFEKTLFFSIIYDKCEIVRMKKILKKKN